MKIKKDFKYEESDYLYLWYLLNLGTFVEFSSWISLTLLKTESSFIVNIVVFVIWILNRLNDSLFLISRSCKAIVKIFAKKRLTSVYFKAFKHLYIHFLYQSFTIFYHLLLSCIVGLVTATFKYFFITFFNGNICYDGKQLFF